MPVTFKTKSYSNITMLGDTGRKMLEFMDFGTQIPGAIGKSDLAQALDDLQKELELIPPPVEAQDNSSDEEPAIALNTRAIPLIALLESAIKENNNLRWE